MRLFSTHVPVFSSDSDDKKKKKKGEEGNELAEVSPVKARMTKVWGSVKKSAHHHWMGLKMLGVETRIASKYLIKLVRGKSLTRRERRQLRKTAADLVRVIPLAVFFLVPFLELLLPVALTLFPNMLPSTFEDETKVKEKRRKELKIRLEMAKFLREVVHEVADDEMLRSGEKRADELGTFMARVQAGESFDDQDVIRIAHILGDKLTLSTLSRAQLQNVCRYLGVSHYGTTAFLKFQLERKFDAIKQDDLLILSEGVDSLSDEELEHAAITRGMRGTGVDPSKLQAHLENWITLHIEEKVPAAMLVLSRALLLSEKVAPTTRIQDTIAALPDEILDEVRAAEDQEDPDKVTEEKLRLLQIEEEVIAKEAAEARALHEVEASLEASAAGSNVPVSPAAAFTVSGHEDAVADLSADELKQLEEAVVTLASDSALEREREALKALKEEGTHDEGATAETAAQGATSETVAAAGAAAVDAAKAVPSTSEAASSSSSSPSTTTSEGDARKDDGGDGGDDDDDEPEVMSKLEKKIAKMVDALEADIDMAELELGSIKSIDIDSDGYIDADELATAVSSMKTKLSEEQLKKLWDQIDMDRDNKISLDELTAYVVAQAKAEEERKR